MVDLMLSPTTLFQTRSSPIEVEKSGAGPPHSKVYDLFQFYVNFQNPKIDGLE
jgi:hypothetical protein